MGRQPLPTNTILGNDIDQYRIDTVLGPGGFGITYLAHDVRFGRDVAIKEYFPAEFAVRDGLTSIRSATRGNRDDFFQQGKRYFLEEARTLGRFRHEHIVRVLNLFEENNTAYMVLEFEDGQSFKNWLRTLGRRPTQEELDAITMPLLSALSAIHEQGMFHRDIAPDNVIIRPSGLPVLIDFGAARNFVRENSHTLGAIVKHGYSPPEQYTLNTSLQGAWSDIYSLSATLYFAIMGEAPEEAARRQLNDTLLPIEQHLDAYHRDVYRSSFIQALNAGLIIKPKDRPQSVAAFKALLEQPSRPATPARTGVAAGRPPVPHRRVADAHAGGTILQPLSRPIAGPASRPLAERTGVASGSSVAGPGGPVRGPLQPSADAQVAIGPAVESEVYPEATARVTGIIALAVAGAAAAAFLSIGGIEHPGGLAASIVVCAGLAATAVERVVALMRAEPADMGRAVRTGAVMLATALAIFWLPLLIWPLTLIMAAIGVVFASRRLGRWVPVTLLILALFHLAAAALLIVLSMRSVQRDPFFLPLMGSSLAVLSALVLASALQIQRRWELAVT